MSALCKALMFAYWLFQWKRWQSVWLKHCVATWRASLYTDTYVYSGEMSRSDNIFLGLRLFEMFLLSLWHRMKTGRYISAVYCLVASPEITSSYILISINLQWLLRPSTFLGPRVPSLATRWHILLGIRLSFLKSNNWTYTAFIGVIEEMNSFYFIYLLSFLHSI